MFLHAQSLLIQAQKRFLSVLVIFGKYFFFLQKLKISKTVLPYFGDSVVGQSSRMSQLRSRGSVLVTCSRV